MNRERRKNIIEKMSLYTMKLSILVIALVLAISYIKQETIELQPASETTGYILLSLVIAAIGSEVLIPIKTAIKNRKLNN